MSEMCAADKARDGELQWIPDADRQRLMGIEYLLRHVALDDWAPSITVGGVLLKYRPLLLLLDEEM